MNPIQQLQERLDNWKKIEGTDLGLIMLAEDAVRWAEVYKKVSVRAKFLGVASPPNGLGEEGYRRLEEIVFPEIVDEEAQKLFAEKKERS